MTSRTHPYAALPDAQFWERQTRLEGAAIDAAPKFGFSIASDDFATAGSCFAQHFGRVLAQRGGRVHMAETRHPLVPEEAAHGYGVFSARYGNLYTTRQFRECVEQALGERPVVCDFAQREDGRWIDLLRPRAVPEGFSSSEEAQADRHYHLTCVKQMLGACRVLVFTLGLTESWINEKGRYSYAICPGVAAGEFDPAYHRFHNLSFEECAEDLRYLATRCQALNPSMKLLLTVSPVMLVATMEGRGAIQSSVASKSILRAAADACVRAFEFADYFPSYEIIAGPQARGRFYAPDGRDVTADGVRHVMDVFFATRMGSPPAAVTPADAVAGTTPSAQRSALGDASLFDAECDELMLGPPGRAGGG
ncbi:MAG: GSCFA domain-containing protein [Betaproteobacteria bacterium]|nr:GSCFA domain-containing protein [Betaproteobacteria bacterium]